jgi:hypothetical protein
MRNIIVLSALFILAACSSGNGISQTAAHIPQPEITIIGRTDLTNVPTVSSGITVHYEFRIVNQAEVPITLRRIDLDSLGGGGITLQSKTRLFNTVIDPRAAQSVDFITIAYIQNPNDYTGRSPVQIRAVALFDSAEGSLQKVVQQQVRPEGSD